MSTFLPNEPANKKPLLVVVPAYNEAATIEEVVRRSLPHADVCVVDDGSTDNTVAIAESIPGTRVLRHEQNTHIAQALLDGFRYASKCGYAHIITIDAGLSHDPGVIPKFFARKEADLVIGIRAVKINSPWYRTTLTWSAKTLTNLALERQGR